MSLSFVTIEVIMSVQSLPHQYPVRTYIALPVSDQSPGKEDLKNIATDRSRVWNQSGPPTSFEGSTNDPCVIVGSFSAENKELAIATAEKIQASVRKQFTDSPTLSTRRSDPRYEIIRYAGSLPNPDARDFEICHVKLDGPFLDSLPQIIEDYGSTMERMSRRRDREGRKVARSDSPFLVIGEIHPAGAEDQLHKPIVPVVKDVKELNLDPNHLLFFPHDGSPNNPHSLDLKNPISFPLPQPPKISDEEWLSARDDLEAIEDVEALELVEADKAAAIYRQGMQNRHTMSLEKWKASLAITKH